jgi:peptidoglycan-associated lipoprotein
MKHTIRAQRYILPLLLSALALTGCSQLQNKKSDKNNGKMTTTINKKGGGDFSGKDLIGKEGFINKDGGTSTTDGFNAQGISSSDLANGNTKGYGVDPDSQAAIDAEIQAAIDSLMADGKGKPLTPADIKNPKSILAQRVIYFDYDQSTILEKYKPVLAAHAELLANYPEMKIRLEGHADERGSREYNVALSERRSETVRQYLSFKNVGSEQMESVAFGEEKPLVPSHDDTAWSKNRRVEINYITY